MWVKTRILFPLPNFLSEREACYFVETQRISLGGRDSLTVGDSGLMDCLARPGPGDERARLADAAARFAADLGRHCDHRHWRVEYQTLRALPLAAVVDGAGARFFEKRPTEDDRARRALRRTDDQRR